MLAVAAFGLGEEASAQQTVVCSNNPGPQEGVECRESSTSSTNIDLDLQDVEVSTTGAYFGVWGQHQGAGDIDIEIWDSTVDTSGNGAYGISGHHHGSGYVGIEVRDSTVSTSGGGTAIGIHGQHDGTGNIDIEVWDSTVDTLGDGAHGIWGVRNSSGDLSIRVEGGSTTTRGDTAHGIAVSHEESGSVGIVVRDGTVSTSGDGGSAGIYSLLKGIGDLTIQVEGGSITTEGSYAAGIYGLHQGTGDVDIQVEGGSVTTQGDGAHGILDWLQGSGNVGIVVRDGTVSTSGGGSAGIYGVHQGTGDVDIRVEGGSVTTEGDTAHGIYGRHLSSGYVGIVVQDGTVSTSGGGSAGIYGLHQGTGDVDIRVEGGSVTTEGDTAHGIYGRADNGSVDIQIQGAEVRAHGMGAHGVQLGTLDENGVVQGSVGLDEEGYRRQTVTVNGKVRGGTGDAAGIFLAGGGRVVVGPNGSVGADSGVAILADGSTGDAAGSRLHVDLTLNGRRYQEVLDGRILNEDGTTTLVANGVVLHDGTGGATEPWAPNGAWDVTARTAEAGGLELAQAYAPRAALYESLPGLLLRLDAGAPVRRPEEPAWAQVGYGVGSGDPERSQTGASYDFDRIEAAAGTTRELGAGVSGSAWLRRLQSEIKVDMPGGSGELELHGVGAGMQAHWDRADGLYASGELSWTDFDVDATSSRHGRLAKDVGAELWQARLEAGYLMAQGGGLTLRPRAWAWHAEADLDDFTDAVGAQVSGVDESRTALGLGMRAELEGSESSLYGSVDVESVLAGEETTVRVSGQELDSESERTRVLVGVGGQQQGKRVMLRGGLRLADPGGRNQEVSASISVSGSF